MGKLDDAKNQIQVLNAYLSSEYKKTATILQHSSNTLRSNISLKKYPSAFENVTMICSSYDKEQAIDYLMTSIKNVQANLNQIFASKEVPSNVAMDIAAMCYAAKLGLFEAVTKYVNHFFVPIYKATEVENLAHSSLVPKELSKLKRPENYTMEELHIFVQNYEKQMRMDFTWFFEQYPINANRPPEHTVNVKIGGRTISNNNIQPPPAAAKNNLAQIASSPSLLTSSLPLPAPKEFSIEDFINMQQDLTKILKNWKDLPTN
ncbi:hypothetical protein TVAG_334050 [Trichomonas vaginalis G3]|uniref:Uncharacterized protein n=1 Tax=Trichomonas vaginalis (strain ATCC PRA-98 / G3) TaxID=412133 RepID=A2EIB1_TRIV3|nr:hypothetical protein TVAGG3_0060410 [Trichomonas vaginalis G3]EAY07593.1 hypothetical protein TVAG_334050 [Trichomonas vaginalis G3]KAI5541961.1 hypothetical protein TVAGG3_0060410 [Trichomonas vaginalis G3]|eukprot:XP_001319816.1 hypothetical protein [Trichomonas vaginalis G3]